MPVMGSSVRQPLCLLPRVLSQLVLTFAEKGGERRLCVCCLPERGKNSSYGSAESRRVSDGVTSSRNPILWGSPPPYGENGLNERSGRRYSGMLCVVCLMAWLTEKKVHNRPVVRVYNSFLRARGSIRETVSCRYKQGLDALLLPSICGTESTITVAHTSG